jgi:uncharacterized protein (DUF1501 family)
MTKLDAMHRRAFLKRAGAVSALGAGAPLALNLAAAGEAAAFTATDYKALVCVFLYGGNDYANTVVPYDTANYALYNKIRGQVALARNALTATALSPRTPQTLTDNLQFALAPELTALKALWDSGQCAVQLNVGPLVVPTTLAQYRSADRKLNPLPPKLFSHNDQQSVWQSLGAEGTTIGWGGRLGDLALSSNTTSSLTCISAAGNAVFVSGDTVLPYQISPNGIAPVYSSIYDFFGTAMATTMKTLITQKSNNVLENEFAAVTQRGLDLQFLVANALKPINITTSFNIDGQDNKLADQMSIVAKLIAARGALGSKRQVFFVSIGGFDNHDGLIKDHGPLMAKVNEAIGQFYKATVELGVQNNVTTFTASDFGRTLSANSDGSDHGWGGHHFMVGGAVKGGQYYGTAPHVSITTDDQVGEGRLLPSTSVDQYAATLARWFGVSDTELPTVLPRIGNFASSNLGFMS